MRKTIEIESVSLSVKVMCPLCEESAMNVVVRRNEREAEYEESTGCCGSHVNAFWHEGKVRFVWWDDENDSGIFTQDFVLDNYKLIEAGTTLWDSTGTVPTGETGTV